MENKPKSKDDFEQLIGEKEERKLEAKHNPASIWSGLGLFGMVGWSVAVPTILGIALGYWLDKKLDTDFSWTLSLLDRKSTRLNSSHVAISYAVFCLKKKIH